MAEQIHRRFTDEQIKLLLDLYLKKVIDLPQALQQLECSRRRFYQILRDYREAPERFTIAYARNKPNRRLPEIIEQAIKEELKIDRQLIRDRETTIRGYNYAFIRDSIRKSLSYKVSAQTVRNRAKKWGYYIPKRNKVKALTREVVTEAAGMLLQHVHHITNGLLMWKRSGH